MTVQGSAHSCLFEGRIGEEKSLMKIESEKVCENIVCFYVRFCRIVEKIEFIESSLPEYFDVILSNECFMRSFNVISIFNIDFPFFVMNKYLDFSYLEQMKVVIEYNEFYNDFHEKNKSEFSVFEVPIVCDLVFMIEIHELLIRKSKHVILLSF
jgi:hypothetical protein